MSGEFLGEAKFNVGQKSSVEPEPFDVNLPSNVQVDFTTYHDNEYGYSISYPATWDVDDEVILLDPYLGQHSGGASPVAFYDDITAWEASVSVNFIRDDYSAKNLRGQNYLDSVVNLLRDDCRNANFIDWGYTCSNHVLVDSKITEIDGRTAFQITETWTQTFEDGSVFRNLSILTDIPVGDNVWTIDSIATASEYPRYANNIGLSVNSFKIWEGGKPPTPSQDRTAPLILVPSDIVVGADDPNGAIVDFSVKAIDDVDGVIRTTCTPSSSSYFPIGTTKVICQASDSAGNKDEKSFTVTVKTESVVIPDWVREVAGFWCNDEIEDSSFIDGIEYLIKNNVIMIPTTSSGSSSTQLIPDWVKNNACWWSENQISDNDFASGLQYLIKNGIIQI